MFLSIIIPTYNRADRIVSTLESIFARGCEDVEIIVVDDGSHDNTEEQIRSLADERIRYIKINNSERGAARNYGLQYAIGEYINFFDSDDVFTADMAQLRQFVTRHSMPPVVYGDIEHMTDSGNAILSQQLPFSSFTANLLHNNFLACGSVFLSRKVFDEFKFNEARELSSAEDWELWLRVHSRYSFLHFPSPVFRQIHHSDRSLMTILPERVQTRDSFFAQVVEQNTSLLKFYGEGRVRLFIADRFTFIALNWCDTDKRRAFHFLVKALSTSLLVCRRRRFWATLKKIVLQ